MTCHIFLIVLIVILKAFLSEQNTAIDQILGPHKMKVSQPKTITKAQYHVHHIGSNLHHLPNIIL